MSVRFTKIDELFRPDHYYLEEDDECYYLLDYYPGVGYSVGGANQLISNLKKSPSQRNQPHYKYKILAIQKVIEYLRGLLPNEYLRDVTLVPMPPSKAKDHEEYDDRIVQILEGVCQGTEGDLRELILLEESIVASHTSANRKNPNELRSCFSFNENLRLPEPDTIIIVDDMITTGSHFKACKNILMEQYPNTRIIGVFVTRRVITEDGEYF